MLELHAIFEGKRYIVLSKAVCPQVLERANHAIIEWHAHYSKAQFEVAYSDQHDTAGYYSEFYDAYGVTNNG